MKSTVRCDNFFGFKDGHDSPWSRRRSLPLEEEASGDGLFLKRSYSAKLSDIAGSIHLMTEGNDVKTSVDAANVGFLPVVMPRRSKSKRFSMTYVALIASAILRFPQKRLTLSQIYEVIEKTFPEFTVSRTGWKNTVRHNLSLHDCFVKGEVAANGKSCYWHIHPAYIARFSRGDFRKRPSKEMCVLDPRRDFKCVRLDAKQPYHMSPMMSVNPAHGRRDHHAVGGGCSFPKPFGLPPPRQPHPVDKEMYPSTEWLNEYKPYPYFYLFSPRQSPVNAPQTEEFYRADKPPYYCH